VAHLSKLDGTAVTAPRFIVISFEGKKAAPLYPTTLIVTLLGKLAVPAPQSLYNFKVTV